MHLNRNKRVFVCAIFVTVALYVSVRVMQQDTIPKEWASYSHSFYLTEREGRRSLINTSGCTIPYLDPFDKSIRHLVSKGVPMKCDSKPPLTYVEKGWVKVNRLISKTHYGDELGHCEYQPIIRGGDGKSDDKVLYEKKVVFKVDALVPHVFIKVTCFGTGGREIYVNFHALITQNSILEGRANSLFEAFKKVEVPKETLNVLMVGIDSVSRLNFIRQMPKTRDYLLNTLDAVEMLGYNKVADNTFVNLVPILTGKYLEELPWNETLSNLPFDKYDMMWKEFSRRGYRTLFAEDAPDIATFNYLKAGFHKQPTDYYYRPLALAMERYGPIWRNGHNCVASKMEIEIVLDWVRDFADFFKNEPHFSFSFNGRLTHDDVNKAGGADEPFVRFLQSLHSNALIKNTVLILYSDHGMRFGRLRNGYIGKMEERLPAMYFVFPKQLHKKYPTIINNIRLNGGRLTSPFDIHETLKDISNFNPDQIIKRKSSQKRGISLFEEIPASRTCTSAGILSHWCTCHSQKEIDPKSTRVQNATIYLVDYINSEIKKHELSKLCETIYVYKVENAYEIVAKDEVLRFKQSLHDVIGRVVTFEERASTLVDYQMTVRTTPGDGLFEVTVRYSEIDKDFKVIGGISRLNKYGDQSICITNQVLKKYCYCRR